MVARNTIGKIADVKGKTVAASAPGTAPFFTLAWMLRKNGLTVKDVTIVNLETGAAAAAFAHAGCRRAIRARPRNRRPRTH